MNLNATPETVAAVAQALKLAGILDDRVANPDKARIAAWSEQVHRHNFTETDLLDGLQRFYDGPTDRAIGIGDLIHHARMSKIDRVQREDAAARTARSEAQATKAAPDEPWPIPAGAITGPTAHKTDRMRTAEDRLHACHNRATAVEALREYFAAKTEARNPQPATKASR